MLRQAVRVTRYIPRVYQLLHLIASTFIERRERERNNACVRAYI